MNTTLTRLETAAAILDEQRLALDKAPLAGNEHELNDIAAVVNTVRDLLDEVCDALTPHTRHLNHRTQSALTGGWVLYDRDRPATWPPTHVTLTIRQYHQDNQDRPRWQQQRRGLYTGAELTWRPRGYRPLNGQADGVPCPPGWVYAWREAA